MGNDNKWEVTHEETTTESALASAFTLGLVPESNDYTVKNTETGEVKHVIAFSKDDLADKISKGDFIK